MEILIAGARALGIDLTAAQVEQFAHYQAELLAWNARTNLTAITDPAEIQRKHCLDALTCLAAFPAGPLSLIDVGSGAGFPGLALKIARPELSVTLLEATGKKTAFLEHVVGQLGLAGVAVLTARAELAGQDAAHRERYDWAVARAVAEMRELAEYLLPFVRIGGHALAQKGRDAGAEAHAAAGALQRLGGRLAEVRRVVVPGLEDDERYLVLIDKVAPTPAAYPRRPGMPHKKPLG